MAKDYKELYEERAAIKEFDGGLPRKQAEEEARIEIKWMWLDDTKLDLGKRQTYNEIIKFERELFND